MRLFQAVTRVILGLVCAIQLVDATHFRFANIQWRKSNPLDPTVVSFEIQTAWRQNFNWNFSPGSVASMGGTFGNGADNVIRWGDGSSLTQPYEIISSSGSANGDNDWMMGVIRVIHKFPAQTVYTVSIVDRCCRISTLVDGNADKDYTVLTTVDLNAAEDAGPTLSGLPIVTMIQGRLNKFSVVPANYIHPVEISFSTTTRSGLAVQVPQGMTMVNGVLNWFPPVTGAVNPGDPATCTNGIQDALSCGEYECLVHCALFECLQQVCDVYVCIAFRTNGNCRTRSTTDCETFICATFDTTKCLTTSTNTNDPCFTYGPNCLQPAGLSEQGIDCGMTCSSPCMGYHALQVSVKLSLSSSETPLDFLINLVDKDTVLPNKPFYANEPIARTPFGAIIAVTEKKLTLKVRGTTNDPLMKVSVLNGGFPIDVVYNRICDEGMTNSYSNTNQCTTTFEWTPVLSQLAIAVIFTTSDKNGLTSEVLQDVIVVYPPQPIIVNITPQGLNTAGGDIISITGQKFGEDHILAFDAVKIDGRICANPKMVSGVVFCQLAPGQGVTAQVTLTLRGVTSDPYPYRYGAPNVVSVNPTQGPTQGNIKITLSGSNFGVDNQDVRVGGAPCAIIPAESSHVVLVCYIAEGWGPNRPVTLTVSGQSSVSQPLFSYLKPVISFTQPFDLPTTGNIKLQMNGVNFGPANSEVSITVGGAVCTHVPATDAHTHSLLECLLPPGFGTKPLIVCIGLLTLQQCSAPFDLTYGTFQFTNVAPLVDTTSGGQVMVITGSNFGLPADVGPLRSVMVGGVKCNEVSWSHTSISCTIPSGSGTSLAIDICIGVVCRTAQSPFRFSYSKPIVTLITPASPRPTAGGQLMTLTGLSFGTAGTGKILWAAGVERIPISQTHTSATFLLPPGVGTVFFQYSSSGQYSDFVSFTYSNPTITALNPTAPGTNFGTYVTITGSNFGSSSTTTVAYVGTSTNTCSSPTFTDTTASSEIICYFPAGQGSETLYVSVGGIISNPWPFTRAIPIVTSVDPASGPTQGGNVILVQGSNFGSSGGVVTINGVACPVVVGSQNHNRIQCTVPAGDGINLKVVYTVNTLSSVDNVFYGYSIPVISSISPSTADVVNVDMITILGSSFSGTPTATIGGKACVGPGTFTDTRIVCKIPIGVGVNLPVIVTTKSLVPSAPYMFSYNPPTIVSISPTSLPSSGVGTITLTGTNFAGTSFPTSTATIRIGANTCTITSRTDTQAICTYNSPIAKTATLQTGHGLVVITVQSLPSSGSVLQLSPPSLTTINPTSGPSSGQSVLTINGASFGVALGDLATSVSVGGQNCPILTQTAIQITCTLPTGSGNQQVTVSVLSIVSNSLPYQYAGPVITKITPNTGLNTAGGDALNVLTIDGTSLGTSGQVVMGALECKIRTPADWTHTQVKCIYPAGSGSVNVYILSGGSSSNSLPVAYNAPVIAGINPQTSPTVGNAIITITGTGFGADGATSFVTVGGNPCLVTPGKWLDTSIVCVTPPGAGKTVPVSVSLAGLATTNDPSIPAQRFSYEAPVITNISPLLGNSEGFSASVVGSNLAFAGLGMVYVQETGRECFVLSASSHSHFRIDCLFPEGLGSVSVVAKIGSVAFGYQESPVYTYTYGAPTVSGVNPPFASTDAQELISGSFQPVQLAISGNNFGTALSSSTVVVTVSVGGKPCPITSRAHVTIVCALAPGEGINLPVLVTVGGAPSNANIIFSYNAPIITSVSPITGPTAGAPAIITFFGRNFGTASAAIQAAVDGSYVAASTHTHTQLTFVLPPGMGKDVGVAVRVNTQNGALAKAFSYDVPIISSITGCTDDAGRSTTIDCPVLGNRQITLAGKNFGTLSTVTMKVSTADCVATPNLCCNVISQTHIQIICTLPPGTGSNVPVYVTTKAQVSLPLALDYVVPVITGIVAATATTSPVTIPPPPPTPPPAGTAGPVLTFAVSATPVPVGAPSMVTDVVAPSSTTPIVGTTAAVTFTPLTGTAAGTSAVTSYTVYATNTATGVTTSSTCATSPCTATGLVAGETYKFAVAATNTQGTGAVYPVAPTVGNTAIVSFTAPTVTGASPITSYSVVATNTLTGATTTQSCVTSPCTFTGLTNGQTYTYTIAPVNTQGTGVVTPTVVAAPTTTVDVTTLSASTAGQVVTLQGRGFGTSTVGTVITYGVASADPTATYKDFTCTPLTVTDTQITCTLEPGSIGGNLAFVITDSSSQVSQPSGDATTGGALLSFPPPEILAGSLSYGGALVVGGAASGAASEGEALTFKAKNVGTDPANLLVTYGPDVNGNDIICESPVIGPPDASGYSDVTCITSAGTGKDLRFTLTAGPGATSVTSKDLVGTTGAVGAAASPPSDFTFSYPTVPILLSASGCADNGLVTENCLTDGGGVLLKVTSSPTGGAFPTDIQAIRVTVDNRNCPVQSATTYTVTCRLPAASGKLVAVLASVLVNNGLTRLNSAAIFAVSYKSPTITAVSGCAAVGGSLLAIQECSRSTSQRITINGENFGGDRAVVLICGDVCTNLVHTVGSEHTQVTCDLQKGTQLDLALVLIQGGQTSTNNGLVSFTQCLPGTYQADVLDYLCTDCAEGTFSSQKGQTVCENCSDGYVAANPKSSTCTACPVGTYSRVGIPGAGIVCTPCSPGSANASPGQDRCVECDLGFYADVANLSACKPCAVGTYSASTGNVLCADCAPGSFSPAVGGKTCKLCSPGTFSLAKAAVCAPCNPGTFEINSGSSVCTACAAGSVQPSGGQRACAPCDAGYFQDLTGQLLCKPCVAGEFSVIKSNGLGAAQCDKCVAGRYAPAPGSSDCLRCLAGSYNDLLGQTICKPCPLGQFSSQQEQTACTDCPRGTFSNAVGALKCIDCSPGTYSSVVKSTTCTGCPAGQSTNVAASTICIDCIAGYANAFIGQSSCSICNVGSIAATAKSVTCAACTSGTVSSNVGQTVCSNCSPGYYQASTGQGSCAPCGLGRYSDLPARTACAACPVGKYIDEIGASMCKDCVAGTFSAVDGASVCKPTPVGTYSLANANASIPCPPGKYQDNSGQSLCLSCQPGTFSASPGSKSCTTCVGGSFAAGLDNQQCTPCSPGTVQSLPGQTKCDNCVAGKFMGFPGQLQCASCGPAYYSSLPASTECLPCLAGTSTTSIGSTKCSDCGVGSYAPNNGTLICQMCKVGEVQPLSGQRSCNACAAGKYTGLGGQSICTDCNIGTAQIAIGQGSCKDCKKGQYSDVLGATDCKSCPKGTYQDLNSPPYSSCTDCPIGKFADQLETATCKTCPVGTYSNSTRSETCTDCPIGFYQDLAGQSGCKKCQPGYTSVFEGLTTCKPCAPGTYAGAADNSCELCPVGFKCDREATVTPIPCAIGEYNNLEGRPLCQGCGVGYFSNVTQATSCFPCAPGSFQVNSGSSACDLCSSGRYAINFGTIQCTDCNSGRFAAIPGGIVCEDCPTGTHQQNSASSSCDLCDPGEYGGAKGQAVCSPCASGFYSPLAGAKLCTACMPGSFSQGGYVTQCSRCQPGEAQNAPGQGNCYQCDAGQFSNTTGLSSCYRCGPGTFSIKDSGASAAGSVGAGGDTGVVVNNTGPVSLVPQKGGPQSCTLCPAGTFFDSFEANRCDNCLPGTFAPYPGMSVCFDCPAGKVQSESGQSTCLDCPLGSFMDAVGQRICDDCEPGKFADVMGMANCTKCKTGSANAVYGGAFCDQCIPGTYSDVEGAIECFKCKKGTYNPLPAQSACLRCEAGTEGPDGPLNNMTDCSPCELGFFSQEGAAACKLCDNLLIAPVRRATRCTPCDKNAEAAPNRQRCICSVGYAGRVYSEQVVGTNETIDSMVCVKCPKGAVCTTKDVDWLTMETETGFWEVTTSEGAANQKDRNYYRCLLEQHCNGDNRARSECAANRWGPLCARCLPGYTEGLGGVCSECPSFSGSVVFFSLIVVVVGLVLFGQMYIVLKSGGELIRSEKRRQKRRMEQEEGFFSPDMADDDDFDDAAHRYSQWITIHGPPTPKPNFTYKLKIMLGFAQISTNMAIGLEVRWPSPFKSFIYYFNPVNIDLVQFSSLGCVTETNYYKKLLAMICVPFVCFAGILLLYTLPKFVLNAAKPESRKMARRKTWKLILFMLFLIYPSVSSVILRTFVCKEVNGVKWLLADFNLECGTSEWSKYAFVAGIFIFVYPLGIPAFFFVMLYRYKNRLDETGVRAQLGFLYDAYTRDVWWFELVDLMHKLGVTSLVAFLPFDWQMPAAMVFVFLYTAIILVKRPYLRMGDDRLHMVAQCEIILFLMAGHVFNYSDEYSDATEVALTVVLISMFLVFLAFFGLQVVHTLAVMWKRSKNAKKREKAIAEGKSTEEFQEMSTIGKTDEFGIELHFKRSHGLAAAQKQQHQKVVDMKRNPMWDGGGDDGKNDVVMASNPLGIKRQLSQIKPGMLDDLDKDGGEKHQPELSAIEPSMSAQLPASMKKELGTHDSDAEATSESEAESEESDGGGAATKFATQRAANR